MKHRVLLSFFFVTSFVANVLASSKAESAVRLPRFISSGMVLQRGDTARVWGWADAGSSVKVQFIGRKYTTVADADGRWSVAIPTQKPSMVGGPYKMQINSV